MPLRFFYIGNAYRAVRPQRGQMREFMQVGVELIGAEAPQGTAEVVEVLVAALDAAGLTRAVIGLGDADLYRQLLAETGVEGEELAAIMNRLAAHDRVGLETEVAALDRIGDGRARDAAAARATCAAAPRCSTRRASSAARRSSARSSRLQATYDAVAERGVADRVQLDLGLLRDLGYYTRRDPRGLRPGARPRPRRRRPLRRADGALRQPLPAAGFGLYLERVHIAQAEEERWGRERELGSPAWPGQGRRAAEARAAARRAVRARRSTCSTRSASTRRARAATRAR